MPRENEPVIDPRMVPTQFHSIEDLAETLKRFPFAATAVIVVCESPTEDNYFLMHAPHLTNERINYFLDFAKRILWKNI